jgi:hypothetical protein
MLWDAQRSWGQLLLHVFDQGFAGFPWLCILVESPVRFLVRWNAGDH